MPKVHLISITEPFILDLAVALCERGYSVSVSGKDIDSRIMQRLNDYGCLCHGDGWFPQELSRDINTVVLGSDVTSDNPELICARDMRLLIQSIPEFIFERTKSKTRVAVAGSSDKSQIIQMMIYALLNRRMAFDYALSSPNAQLPNLVSLRHTSPIALIEGDEQLTSALERRFLLEFYRPHIAILTHQVGSEENSPTGQEAYFEMFRSFIHAIERDGKLIYCEEDERICRLVEEVRSDITCLPYRAHAVIEKEGGSYLPTRFGEFPLYLPNDAHFLFNINAARLACRQMGMKEIDFYQAISEYSLSLQA
ncbi:UDP-N-acetylmuramate--alanine ligase [Parabacteroides sp. OttesenSCG-928-N08]|nr:UDP-N-acetylmuramate--alanine ligase [Parabacteroides sp. OttesenSCG-928-N08]